MKIRALYLSIACLLCLFITQQAQAQNVWGYSSIDYDDATGYVSVSSTTELDYWVQEYYRARVISRLSDENGQTLVLLNAQDNFGIGFVTLTYGVHNSTAEEFEVVATHYGVATLYDYALHQYWDYFNYLWFPDFNINSFASQPFLGPGPPGRTTGSILQVGKTHSYAHKAVARVSLSLRATGNVEPFPEFEDYSSTVIASGTDQLGPLPMGQGRNELPGQAYTFATLVIGQVASPSSYGETFQWKRLITRRSWFIRYEAATNRWLVTQRSFRGTLDDDTGSEAFNDSTPSSAGRIYIYDNSALFPIIPSSPTLGIGEYIREEKAFTYIVEYKNGANWVRAGRKDYGQVLTVRRNATTGTVSSDWTGIENSFSARKLDAVIKPNEVRSVVGNWNNASIVIDLAANN